MGNSIGSGFGKGTVTSMKQKAYLNEPKSAHTPNARKTRKEREKSATSNGMKSGGNRSKASRGRSNNQYGSTVSGG